VALRHPTRPEDVTIGLLCDGTRYKKSDDPVEWDIFRTEILESQGWQLLRILSPNLFRDVEGTLKKTAAESQKLIAKQMMEEKRSATSTVQ
jgi:very-short-patch-repair endonuclease